MPRNKWRRSRMVKQRIGMKNNVVAAATAGQSWPPSPMMKGMKGGIVCASPLVSKTAKAYSFQAKIKHLEEGLQARVAVDHRGLFILARDLVHESLQ